MKHPLHLVAALAVGAVLIVGAFYAGRHSTGPGGDEAPSTPASAPAGKRVLYWHDPMAPDQRFDKPGKSPFMDMPLVPVYADDSSGSSGSPDTQDSGVRVSPAIQQNLGIRTTAVRRTDVAMSFDAVGTVQFDERLSVAVQTRVAGYVERLDVRAPMERVRRGQALATIFAPDWLGPQAEYLALRRTGASQELVEAARERLRSLSIPDALVRHSEAEGDARARFTLTAPIGGVVVESSVREGVAVTPGTTLLRIAGLEKVWAVVDVPEAQALRLSRGQTVQAVLQADPSQTFAGSLAEILPQINAATRTLQARFELDNRGGGLTPGMLLRLRVAGPSVSRLVVPSEAVIRTGRRALVIVRQAGGAFEPRDVALGVESADDTEILQGLRDGEQVVSSGQFLIDSEARLRSVTAAMSTTGASAPPLGGSVPSGRAAGVHAGDGTVQGVDADSLTISHGPIASLNRAAATTRFFKPTPRAYAGIRPGDSVHFEFRQDGTSRDVLSNVDKPLGGTPR